MAQVSIARLFEENREKLKLEWIAGSGGGARTLDSELTKDSSRGLIGHLNFNHPNLIQVLGASEIVYLTGWAPPAAARCWKMRRRGISPASSSRARNRCHRLW